MAGWVGVAPLVNLALLVLSSSLLVFVGLRLGLSTAQRELIETLKGQVEASAREIAELERRLEAQGLALALYKERVEVLVALLQERTPPGSPVAARLAALPDLPPVPPPAPSPGAGAAARR